MAIQSSYSKMVPKPPYFGWLGLGSLYLPDLENLFWLFLGWFI